MKGKAQRYDHRKKFASKAKKHFSNKLHEKSENDSERPHRRTRFNTSIEDSSSSDSEPLRRHARTRKNQVRGKAKDKGSSKSKSKPVTSKNKLQDQTRHSLDGSGHAATSSQGHSSATCPYKSCTDHHKDYRRSTFYSYTGPQLGFAARSNSTGPPRQRPQFHEQQHDIPQASTTVPEPPKSGPSPVTPPSNSPRFDPYATLSSPHTSTITTIRATIRALSFRFYPDKQHGKSNAEIQDAYDRMCEINNAKDVLLDETRKLAYDDHGVVKEDKFEEWLEKQKSERHRR
ncbi:hypothetical protein E8E11_011968 [Didymella keratinophila]|nr:hypothetical protein E8E11_011968 [Didymella keratinophila]